MDVHEVFARYRIQYMKANTSMIKFMEKATKYGSLITLSTSVTMSKGCGKDKGNSSILTETIMKAVGWKTSCMVLANMCGPLKGGIQ